MNTLTESQYNDLRSRYDRHIAWVDSLRTSPKAWVSYDPETEPVEHRITNEEVSAIEVYEFLRDQPSLYFAYVKITLENVYFPRCQITTWMGDLLGEGNLGKPYVSNFGDTRRSIRVKGINGVTYSGTFYQSSGNYCRLRAVKA